MESRRLPDALGVTVEFNKGYKVRPYHGTELYTVSDITGNKIFVKEAAGWFDSTDLFVMSRGSNKATTEAVNKEFRAGDKDFHKGDKVKTKGGSKIYTVISTQGTKVFVKERLTPLSSLALIKLPPDDPYPLNSRWVEDAYGDVVKWSVGDDIIGKLSGNKWKITGFPEEPNGVYISSRNIPMSTTLFKNLNTKGENMGLEDLKPKPPHHLRQKAIDYNSLAQPIETEHDLLVDPFGERYLELNEAKPQQNIPDNSLEGRYAQIVGTVQSMSHEINATTELQSSAQLTELFAKAKGYVEKYEITKKKDTSGFFSKLFGSDKKKEEELDSINKSTDAIFNVIHNEYNKLVETGTKFQRLKADMTKQLKDLEELKLESNAEMIAYTSKGEMVPMKLISTNTQIEASCEAYKEKLLKIEVGITLTTGAVIALGAKLPAMRAGLADETAYAALIGSVSNVHEVVKGTSDLILGIADLTSAEAHKKVDEMMQAQINDTSTVDYLQSRRVHSDALATMIYTNADLLAEKLMLESNTVKQMVLESKAGGSTQKLEQLNYTKSETLSLSGAPYDE